MKQSPSTFEPYSILTCPECGHQSRDLMPTNACHFYYACKACEALIKPKSGDCCVYCSYGDKPCPPIQLEQGCC
ncbi:MAG: GDCCVxC domain-containing (seleno)protein [Planctomycetota bacterium]